MTKNEFQKVLLNRMILWHGKDSDFYIRLQEKMLKFSEKDWEQIVKLYTDENGQVDVKRALMCIRSRRR